MQSRWITQQLSYGKPAMTFFRVLFAIPRMIWAFGVGIVMTPVMLGMMLWAVITGRRN
jgi:hypothetical protein